MNKLLFLGFILSYLFLILIYLRTLSIFKNSIGKIDRLTEDLEEYREKKKREIDKELRERKDSVIKTEDSYKLTRDTIEEILNELAIEKNIYSLVKQIKRVSRPTAVSSNRYVEVIFVGFDDKAAMYKMAYNSSEIELIKKYGNIEYKRIWKMVEENLNDIDNIKIAVKQLLVETASLKIMDALIGNEEEENQQLDFFSRKGSNGYTGILKGSINNKTY